MLSSTGLLNLWHSFFRRRNDPRANVMAAINLRCLEGVELETVPVQQFNGRAL
jgi:hypothetical protein